eukprot:TRINITY_DN103141_c0_g1_i1.p1 TRINITY_DN103141_c0_g1~~TRINITY_DN103141_c0_g1_i1.p1  ORF type:complete len:359 (-),score=49.06 TRINITY_DN103141_c0_g1_i1:244-1320(-)
MASTMRHIQYEPGCDPSGLKVVTDGGVPVPAPNEVLIQVAYCGVGGTDMAQRKGNFNPKPDCPKHHRIMGLEVSGVVTGLGADVAQAKEKGALPKALEKLQVGSRVAALLYGGGYAEYTVVPLEQLLMLPDCLTLEQGAAVPENFWTVFVNVFMPDFGNLLKDASEKTLLVHGGAGGIGSTAITLARYFGTKRIITTVSSAEKAKFVKEKLGEDVVTIDYTKQDFVQEVKAVTDGHGADVILCFVGGDYVAKNVDALAFYGRLVQIGLRKGKDVTFDLKVLMHKFGVLTGGHLRPRSLKQKEEIRDELAKHVVPGWESGKLSPPEVQEVLGLADAGKAHERLANGNIIGKLILDPTRD